MAGLMDPGWIWMPLGSITPSKCQPCSRHRILGSFQCRTPRCCQHPTIPVSLCSTVPSFHNTFQHQLQFTQGKEREITSGRGTGRQEPGAEGGLKLAKES